MIQLFYKVEKEIFKGDDSMKWKQTSIDERETIINFDYLSSIVNIYTTNQATGNRISKKIGSPTETHFLNKEVFSMEWKIPFKDREAIKKGLSISNFVSMHQSEKECSE